MPVHGGRLRQQGIAAGVVDELVERQIGVHERCNLATAYGGAARSQERLAGHAQLGTRGRRGALRRQPVKRAAHRVQLRQKIDVQRRNANPLLVRRIHDQPLPLQHPKRLQHGLTRHTEPFGGCLLGQPLARGPAAAADRIEQGLVDTIDQVDRCGKRGKQSGSVFRIQNTR